MKHKSESWAENDATPSSNSTAAANSGVRRSLTRAGLQLGQLSHAVSGALSTLQGGANPRGAAQNRMRALLNQDRALLSHRACGQASLEDAEAPEVPVKGSQTRSAAQNRMRELLHQDRALLALREAKGLERAELDADEDFYLRFEQPEHQREPAVSMVAVEPRPAAVADSSASRATCLGVSTCFVAEPAVATVCTPGPLVVAALAPVAPVAPVAAVAMPPVASVVSAPVVMPVSGSPRPSVAPTADAEPAPDPIRTRGMAKLLALQGYKDRALSIYDELLALEPDNTELRAEADRLRH